jgi:hypothetical protein
MCLASQCRYPPHYFHDLGANNDEDLENERNDVRDVLRCISTSSASDGKPTSRSAMKVTSCILLRLVQACAQPIQEIKDDANMLFPETALHAFSALAKPLNSMVLVFAGSPSEDHAGIFTLALNILSTAGQRLIRAFPVVSVADILPLSRLFNLAVSSLSPMLSALATIQAFESNVLNVVDTAIQAASLSLVRLPELTSPSTLRSTRYDIRGAMRSPGGDDHVGCLALLRLASESEVLARVFVSTKESVVIELCKLYEQLKTMEHERGRGVLHGRGVLPKSRRILLGVICHLEVTTGGAAGASGVLKDIFFSAVNSVASLNTQINQPTADMLFQICEHVFDLAAFSPTMVRSLFDFKIEAVVSPEAMCMKVLHDSGVFGYKGLSDSNIPQESIFQVSNRSENVSLSAIVALAGCIVLLYFSHIYFNYSGTESVLLYSRY